MENIDTNAQEKQPYERPSLIREGSLSDVTRGNLGGTPDPVGDGVSA